MAYDLHIIKTSDFIRLDAHGKPDLKRSRLALDAIARSCVERGVNCVLLDVRDMKSDLTISELYRLARSFHDIGFRPEHRVAVLHKYRSPHAEIFVTFADHEGMNIRGFEDYEQAIEWFSAAEPLDEKKNPLT